MHIKSRSLHVFALVMSLAASGVSAQTADLISHNGFEVCWPKAVTESSLLSQMGSSLEGVAGCIPASTGSFSMCTTTMCPGNVAGCPITLRSRGSATMNTLDIAGGTATIDVPGNVDPFSAPVTLPVVGDCTLNIINTDNLTVYFPVYVLLHPDGNDGYYASDTTIGTLNLVGLTSDDVTITGGISCAIASFGLSPAITAITSGAGPAGSVAIQQATDGQSMCPIGS